MSVSAWLPPQHGAWAFLTVPVLLGLSVASPTPLHIVFTLAWVAAYPLSYFGTAYLRARPGSTRRLRLLRPIRVYAVVVAPLVVVLLALRPWLVWAGLAWLVAYGLGVWFARHGAERSLTNDLISVGVSASAVPVVWALGVDGFTGLRPPPIGLAPADVWALTASCFLAFTGATLQVKSLIRERRDPRWAMASWVFALVALVIATWLSPWLFVPFAFLLARAVVVGRIARSRAHASPARPPLRPVVIGGVEIVGSVLLVVFGWLV